MLGKVLESIKTHGLAGTVSRIAGVAWAWVKPHHLAQHLRVPAAMIRHPRHGAYWIRDRFDRRTAIEQGLPWIAWPCIDFLDSYLEPSHRVFEWGGGGSTVFFLAKGCRVTTVESSEVWLRRITEAITDEQRARLTTRFVPLESNDDPNAGKYIAAVDEGGPWDVVLVDGWKRRECLDRALPHLAPDGIIVFDNADHAQYAEVSHRMVAWGRAEFPGLGPGRSWVTKTDVYVQSRRGARSAADPGQDLPQLPRGPRHQVSKK